MMNRWLLRLVLLYAVWFISGLALLYGNWLPSWRIWMYALFLILGGVTSLVWYTKKYGRRHALILFVVCSSISYAAGWLGLQMANQLGSAASIHSLGPLAFGIPMAIPFAWCMLLIIGKALAPAAPSPDVWRGMPVSLKEEAAEWKHQFKRNRARRRKRSLWLPALWASVAAAAMGVLFEDASAGESCGSRTAAGHALDCDSFYEAPLSFLSWWITVFLIVNVVNYLHDEYVERQHERLWPEGVFPLLLLLTLESLFLTLALNSGLWQPVILNIGVLSILFFWRNRANANESRS